MKNNIIKSLEDLAAHEATKREKGFQFKIAMYRKAIKAFRSSNRDPKNLNDDLRLTLNAHRALHLCQDLQWHKIS